MNEPVFFAVAYFLLMFSIGIYSWFKIRTPSDYYVAGKKAGLIPVSSSLLATILGGAAILGTIELGRDIGWAALWFLFCASFGLFLLVPLAKYVRRYGKYTLPDLLEHFYGSQAQFISSLVIPVAWLGIVGAQIIAAGKILAGLGFISYQGGVMLAGVVFIFYTLFGGQISILKTDLFQLGFIIAGLVSLSLFAFYSPETTHLPPLQLNALFNESFSGFDLLILILTYSVTFVVGPDIYSRLFCAKNEKTATHSVLIAAVVLIPISFALTFLGIYSHETGSAEIISFARHLLPGWFYGLLIAALLSAVMSSADTTLLTSSLILSGLFYADMEKPKALQLTRILIIVLGVLSMVIALFVDSILQSLLLALSFFSGAFVVPTLAGLLRFRVVETQLKAAILIGGFFALAGKLITLWGDPLPGNLIIIAGFTINAALIFIPLRNRKKP
jgi:SSS family solute:Na+ symporter